MCLKSWASAAALVAVWMWSSAGAAPAPLLTEVHTVAGPTVAVPLEFDVSISSAGNYQITLTDLGALLPTPAPLTSVALALTSGGSIVGTPLTAAGSTTFSATQGAYVIHVVGNPGTVPGAGPIGVTVSDSSGNVIGSFSGTLALPASAVPGNQGLLQGSFTVPNSGNYQINLSDLQFPAGLGTLSVAIVVQGGALVTTLPAAGTTTTPLQSGVTYDIFAVGQAASTAVGGLYGVNVSPAGGGTSVYANSVPVGAVMSLGSPTLSAGNCTLTLTDLALPAALSQLGAAVTLSGQSVTQLTAAGSAPFTATAGSYQVFAYGTPASSGSGSYALTIQPATGPAALDVGRAVAAAGGAVSAYSFDATVASPGKYAVAVSDFAYPNLFATISTAVVQSGKVLGSQLNTPGTFDVTAAAGQLSLLVLAQPVPAGGLFGIDLTASGAPSATFETTQGVGTLFSVQKLTIPSAGNYQATLSDVGFPAPFSNLAVIVTQGSNKVGAVLTSGAFNFAATSGDYDFSFVAQPDASNPAAAGTYALTVTSAAAPPTVTFSGNPTTVGSGGTVNLTWSSQNASSCVGTGGTTGWTGSKPTSGSATSAPVTAATTFTLTCTGAGGSKAQSVSVSLSAPSSGGGGALEPGLLLGLLAALLQRVAPVTRPSRKVPRVVPVQLP